jgi:GT2 family glycosyltransferase
VKFGVSIVISSAGVREASWERLRSCLEAVAAQHVSQPIEVVLVEIAGVKVSESIRDILPWLRVLPSPNPDHWARKTWGVRNASAPIVAFLDADSMPQAGWLQAMLDTFQYYPEVAAVRGQDVNNWLDRLVPGRRGAGPTGWTAETNIAFRREAYLDCPFPEGSGMEAVQVQTDAMRRAGYVLWADSAMQVMRDRRGLKQALGLRVQLGSPSGAAS